MLNCVSEDLKCWGAWDTTCGTKPRTSHHRSPWAERGRKRLSVDDLPSKRRDAKGAHGTCMCIQGCWGNGLNSFNTFCLLGRRDQMVQPDQVSTTSSFIMEVGAVTHALRYGVEWWQSGHQSSGTAWKSRWTSWASTHMIVPIVSVEVKQHQTKKKEEEGRSQSSGAVWKSRWTSSAPRP